jgi:hypothetical protein
MASPRSSSSDARWIAGSRSSRREPDVGQRCGEPPSKGPVLPEARRPNCCGDPALSRDRNRVGGDHHPGCPFLGD